MQHVSLFARTGFVLFAGWVAIAPLRANPPQPIVITTCSDAVTLDGELDDPLWRNAARFAPFYVLNNAARPTEMRNEAMAAVKDSYLYIAYRLQEPHPAGIKAIKLKDTAGLQDTAGIWADDCVETFLSLDQISWSHLTVNATGTVNWDQRDIGKPNPTWYPVSAATGADWSARAAIGVDQWTCEIRVKLADLFGSNVGGNQKLFVNFTRHRVQGDQPYATWAMLTGQSFAAPEQFVPITLNLPPAPNAADRGRTLDPHFTRTLGVPDLMLAGQPVKLTRAAGRFTLPAADTLDIDDQAAIDTGVSTLLRDALTRGPGPRATVQLRIADVFDDASLSADEKSKLQSPEAFKLELADHQAGITGRTHEGVLRGVASLILMANRARFDADQSLPAMVLYDAPRLGYRGWVIGVPTDPRQAGQEKDASLKRSLDAAFLLRYNRVFFRIGRWSGKLPFPFESFPISDGKRTREEWIALADYARARGLHVNIEFNCWNGAQFLKAAPDGAKLLIDEDGKYHKDLRNVDAANPEARKVILGLMKELIDALRPEGFNICLDELHYGPLVTSPAAKALQWKPSDWMAAVVRDSYDLCRRENVRLYIWGDMLDPDYNGKHIDMTGEKLMARLPGDITLFDWKYDGKLDPSVDYPSFTFFRDAGFPTLGGAWFRPKNIARWAGVIARHHGEGMALLSYNSTECHDLLPEVVRALAMTSYYSWSPEDCDLSHLKFLPDALTEAAVYWSKVPGPAGSVTPITVTEGLTTGPELMEMLGLPADTSADVLATSFRNYRGVTIKVFTQNDQPAALVVPGRAPVAVTIPVHQTARVITFMHTTDHQDIAIDDMHGIQKKYKDIHAAIYQINYTDGTREQIPLPYRIRIVAANDTTLGREMDIGLFGTVGGKIFVNLPTYTCVNPHPDKKIDSISILPGNTQALSLIVLGISLD